MDNQETLKHFAKRLDLRMKAVKRLEELREAINNESISWGEIIELSELSGYIDVSDCQLLEWAGVPEQISKLEYPL